MKFCQHPKDFGVQLRGARAVVVPGSGSMNSLWWHDWLYVKAAEVWCAKRYGVPVVMTSQGIGPAFHHWLDRWVAKSMFNACDYVGVRDDAQSKAILTALGVPPAKVIHTGDDALHVPPDDAAAARILSRIPAGRVLVGLNVRDSHTYGRGYAKPRPKVWAQALDLLVAQGIDAHFVFIPISYDAQDDDRLAARQVRSKMVAQDRVTLVEEELDASVLRALAARMHVGTGISYHFLLFCLSAAVPALGMWQNPYYEHKQSGLFSLYGEQDCALSMAGQDPIEMAQLIRQLILERASRQRRLSTTSLALERVAQSADAKIAEVLQPARR
jgi:polysaccharide pyruvyl transferase WcaK-like protein